MPSITLVLAAIGIIGFAALFYTGAPLKGLGPNLFRFLKIALFLVAVTAFGIWVYPYLIHLDWGVLRRAQTSR